MRAKLLAELPGMSAADVMARMEDGLPKLHVLHEGLRLRRERIRSGLGLRRTMCRRLRRGAKAEQAVAFLRGECVMTVAQVYPQMLAGDWADTTIAVPRGAWRNRLTGEQVTGGDVALQVRCLGEFPVALLTREEN